MNYYWLDKYYRYRRDHDVYCYLSHTKHPEEFGSMGYTIVILDNNVGFIVRNSLAKELGFI